mgnify:CR=1 FL=1
MMNWSTGWNGGGWAAMSLMTLFWAALIGLAIWAAVRLMAPRGSGTHPVATPRATLDARLASGAIDASASVPVPWKRRWSGGARMVSIDRRSPSHGVR